MAYVTYTTEALVCGTYDKNTADRSYLLFTKEAGMLFADARSVREERSKQRYALQEFSLVRVSLIKGKRGWYIGSIEAKKNYYHSAIGKEARGSVVSIFRLLRRFMKGEELISGLFPHVVDSLFELSKEVEQRQFVLLVTQVKMLAMLGYVDKKRIPESVNNVSVDDIHLSHSEEIATKISELYTYAVSISHL